MREMRGRGRGKTCVRGEREGKTNLSERRGRRRDKFARGEKREWERQIRVRGEGERKG